MRRDPLDYLARELDALKAQGLYRHLRILDGEQSHKTSFDHRQVVNVLECLRTMLHWARSAQVRKLPADWVSPLTPDLIGQPPAKDPLREDKLPMATRIAPRTRSRPRSSGRYAAGAGRSPPSLAPDPP